MQHAQQILQQLSEAALKAVAPDRAVWRHLQREGSRLLVYADDPAVPVWSGDLSQYHRVRVLGAGKGAAPMTKALEDLLGEYLTDGCIVVKYDHNLPPDQHLGCVEVQEAAHPVPDESGAKAARRILDLAEDSRSDDLVLCVLTGGASALTPAPAYGITLAEIQALTQQLLQCGATIHEINAIRKHLSCFSGGNLARAVFPATLLTLIVSDVVGDNLDVIASGPTVPDESTYADCLAIVEKYQLQNQMPERILCRLQEGAQGQLPETPKAGDPVFASVHTVLIACVGQALHGAADAARQQGLDARILTETMTGEARTCAHTLISEARSIQRTLKDSSVCLLAGGESTVTLRGTGKGGRNQEMALAALIEMENDSGISMLCLGTDGTDGPTDAAGGYAFSGAVASLRARGLSPELALANNDSYTFLDQAGYLVRTGPTRTNVMDIVLVLVEP